MSRANEPTVERIKIALFGDTQAGKSQLSKSLADKPFQSTYEPTIYLNLSFGIDLSAGNGVAFKYNIFDFSGDGKLGDSITRWDYCKTASIVFLCFDMANRESFENIKNIWLKEARQCTRDQANLILVGLKSDLIDQLKVTPDEMAAYISTEPTIASSIAVSNFTGQNITLLKKVIREKYKPALQINPPTLHDSVILDENKLQSISFKTLISDIRKNIKVIQDEADENITPINDAKKAFALAASELTNNLERSLKKAVAKAPSTETLQEQYEYKKLQNLHTLMARELTPETIQKFENDSKIEINTSFCKKNKKAITRIITCAFAVIGAILGTLLGALIGSLLGGPAFQVTGIIGALAGGTKGAVVGASIGGTIVSGASFFGCKYSFKTEHLIDKVISQGHMVSRTMSAHSN